MGDSEPMCAHSFGKLLPIGILVLQLYVACGLLIANCSLLVTHKLSQVSGQPYTQEEMGGSKESEESMKTKQAVCASNSKGGSSDNEIRSVSTDNYCSILNCSAVTGHGPP